MRISDWWSSGGLRCSCGLLGGLRQRARGIVASGNGVQRQCSGHAPGLLRAAKKSMRCSSGRFQAGSLSLEHTVVAEKRGKSKSRNGALSATCEGEKILVANRGEIAVRIIRTAHEMGIPCVAVHSTIDRQALHVQLADQAVCIGEAPSSQSWVWSYPSFLYHFI